MLAGPGAFEQIVERRRLRGAVDQLRLLGPAPSHRDDDDAVALPQQPGHVSADGRLADPLPRSDHGDRRHPGRRSRRRPELEIGAVIGEPGSERVADEPEALALAQHRLVGEVDDPARGVLAGRGQHAGGGIAPGVLERDAVVRHSAQLLGTTEEQGRDDLVVPPRDGERRPHHRRVVLTVHERDGPRGHVRPAAESCGGGDCFSYSAVCGEKRIRRSRPWNGYLR